MPEYKNSIVDLKRYLATGDRPLDGNEFKEFWESLTEEEKVEFKDTELNKK